MYLCKKLQEINKRSRPRNINRNSRVSNTSHDWNAAAASARGRTSSLVAGPYTQLGFSEHVHCGIYTPF